MLILAIECSGIGGSVALFHQDLPLCYQELPTAQNSIQSLAVNIRCILDRFQAGEFAYRPENVAGGSRLDRPQLICVSHGPGSFTGLRVGLATAKMLAWAWEIPLAGVDSLACICQRAEPCMALDSGQTQVLIAVMNAYRKQLFAAAWEWTPSAMIPLAASQVVNADAWMAQPAHSLHWDRPLPCPWPEIRLYASGPGLIPYQPKDCEQIKLIDPGLWMPRAVEVAQLGWLAAQRGAVVSPADLQANYVRPSAAEEKRAAGAS